VVSGDKEMGSLLSSSGSHQKDFIDFFHDAATTTTGRILLSILWGFALAALFRHACNGRQCIITTSPVLSEIHNSVYKLQNKCYRYEASAVACPTNAADTGGSTAMTTAENGINQSAVFRAGGSGPVAEQG
jgi:hypothetical protein